MTLVAKLNLNMVKMYQHTKHEVSLSSHPKDIAQTQTDRQQENITFSYTQEVIIFSETRISVPFILVLQNLNMALTLKSNGFFGQCGVKVFD